MSHVPKRNYAKSVKYGIGTGALFFITGELGQIVAPIVQGSIPDWELSLFVWLSAGGILIALLSVFLFGIALPLVET